MYCEVNGTTDLGQFQLINPFYLQPIQIQVGNEDDNKAMVLWSSGSEEKAEICKNQNFKNRFTIVDCDGDVVTVDHNQKDLVEIAQDEDGYFLRVLDGDKVSNGVPLMITLGKFVRLSFFV